MMGAAPFLHMPILGVLRIFGVVKVKMGNKWVILVIFANPNLAVLRIFWGGTARLGKNGGAPLPLLTRLNIKILS